MEISFIPANADDPLPSFHCAVYDRNLNSWGNQGNWYKLEGTENIRIVKVFKKLTGIIDYRKRVFMPENMIVNGDDAI